MPLQFIYIYTHTPPHPPTPTHMGCTGSWLLPAESRRYCLIAVNGVFIVALLVGEHRLQGARPSVVPACGFCSCSSWALECGLSSQLPCGMWDPWSRDRSCVSCIARKILNLCPTMEAPSSIVKLRKTGYFKFLQVRVARQAFWNPVDYASAEISKSLTCEHPIQVTRGIRCEAKCIYFCQESQKCRD